MDSRNNVLADMSHLDMAAAWWANWCLLSLQMMQGANLAVMRMAAGSYAGGMKAVRSCYESLSNGIPPSIR